MEPLTSRRGGSLHDLRVVLVGGSARITVPPAYLDRNDKFCREENFGGT